jgi:hypothetical protein
MLTAVLTQVSEEIEQHHKDLSKIIKSLAKI